MNVAPQKTPAVDGTCCSCGYDGDEETPCTAREDQAHCVHWWEGPDDEDVKARDV